MNSIYCGQCGTKNDSQNNFCTNCGNNLVPKKASKPKLIEKAKIEVVSNEVKTESDNAANNSRIFWIIAITVIIIIYLLMNEKGRSGNVNNINPTTVEKFVAADYNNAAFAISQQFVTARLKSPSTADFPLLGFKCISNDVDSTFKVLSFVDSQNGFGATVRTHFQIILKYKGGDTNDKDSWQLLHLNMADN